MAPGQEVEDSGWVCYVAVDFFVLTPFYKMKLYAPVIFYTLRFCGRVLQDGYCVAAVSFVLELAAFCTFHARSVHDGFLINISASFL